MNVASVAEAITSTVAVRTPTATTGSASGQRTRSPTAARSSRPARRFQRRTRHRAQCDVGVTRIGGSARTTKASSAGRNPNPAGATEREDGQRRDHAKAAGQREHQAAGKPAIGAQAASGMPIATASASAAPASVTCSPRWAMSPRSPAEHS